MIQKFTLLLLLLFAPLQLVAETLDTNETTLADSTFWKDIKQVLSSKESDSLEQLSRMRNDIETEISVLKNRQDSITNELKILKENTDVDKQKTSEINRERANQDLLNAKSELEKYNTPTKTNNQKSSLIQNRLK